MKRLSLSFLALCAVSILASAQTSRTACSLFWRSDSLQVTEIVSENEDQYKKVGHHGPAVENSHMALSIYFNNSGAIDVYSKNGRGMELLDYKWYPSVQAQTELGVGCDEYRAWWKKNWDQNIYVAPKKPEPKPATEGSQMFRYEHPDLVREGIVWSHTENADTF